MARAFDMAVLAWDVLDGGILTGKYNRAPDGPTSVTSRYGAGDVSERSLGIAEVVMEVAAEIGCTPAQVAISWVRAQQHRALIVPIVGARSEAQMRENLRSLEVEIPAEGMRRLDEAGAPNLGFPHTFLASSHVKTLIFGETFSKIEDHRGNAGQSPAAVSVSS
jgi:aryl-alcohol dehydrogenase-like predicted oxidoreductase